MGGHDAELILVAGALLAAGIVGGLLADRMRIPGLLLFLGLGMLAGSEGGGGDGLDSAGLAPTLRGVALGRVVFQGGLAGAEAGGRGGDRARPWLARRARLGRRAPAHRRHLPGGDDRGRRDRLWRGGSGARVRPALGLPDRTRAWLRQRARPAHDR